MKQADAFSSIAGLALRESRANGPSLGPRKGRQHDARITVLSFRYGSVNAQCDKRSTTGLPNFPATSSLLDDLRVRQNAGLTEIDI
jgi:hypothetical protein